MDYLTCLARDPGGAPGDPCVEVAVATVDLLLPTTGEAMFVLPLDTTTYINSKSAKFKSTILISTCFNVTVAFSINTRFHKQL